MNDILDDLKDINKRLKKDLEKVAELDEDADIPISEKKVKDTKKRNI